METTTKNAKLETTSTETTNAIVLANEEIQNQIQMVKSIAELYDNVEIVNPQFQFLSFEEKGQSFVGIYKGKSHIDKLDKEFAIFLGGDACYYLSNNFNLMNLPDELIGKPVRITYLGDRTFKKDGEVKKVKLFTIVTIK